MIGAGVNSAVFAQLLRTSPSWRLLAPPINVIFRGPPRAEYTSKTWVPSHGVTNTEITAEESAHDSCKLDAEMSEWIARIEGSKEPSQRLQRFWEHGRPLLHRMAKRYASAPAQYRACCNALAIALSKAVADSFAVQNPPERIRNGAKAAVLSPQQEAYWGAYRIAQDDLTRHAVEQMYAQASARYPVVRLKEDGTVVTVMSLFREYADQVCSDCVSNYGQTWPFLVEKEEISKAEMRIFDIGFLRTIRCQGCGSSMYDVSGPAGWFGPCPTCQKPLFVPYGGQGKTRCEKHCKACGQTIPSDMKLVASANVCNKSTGFFKTCGTIYNTDHICECVRFYGKKAN